MLHLFVVPVCMELRFLVAFRRKKLDFFMYCLMSYALWMNSTPIEKKDLDYNRPNISCVKKYVFRRLL